jgi:AmmeMemoRadiSam system protein B
MAGLVFGCMVPHPPLLVPDVGKGQEAVIKATSGAMEKLAGILDQKKPETVVFISPHTQLHSNAMGILTAESSVGDMSRWGASRTRNRFENDLELVELILEEATTANIATSPFDEGQFELDWGIMVPMHFLQPALRGVPLLVLAFSFLSLKTHFAYGQAIKRAIDRSQKKVALIASGDLSHRLIPSAPAGYDPMGKVFDERLIKALSSMDIQDILNMEPVLIERAGECGLRSSVILLGALDGLKVKPEILSYEGPFGVGYLVASFEIIP